MSAEAARAPGRWGSRAALALVLALAATLRLWQLSQNGYGRQYYAAGVRSMLQGWHNFFYNAFDPAGFVSIDKPPLALWAQVAGAKLLGFSAFGVMLPQVLMGLAAVVLVHRLVARTFGPLAGLLAALFLALTPICVAVDRSNNTESCLVLVLLLAAAAALRATGTTRGRWLVAALALVGVGFNVKMVAALALAPTLVLVWWCGTGGLPLRRRVLPVVVGSVAMAVASLTWVAAFDLTPAAQRPYAGSTQRNSMAELTLLHNGLNRFVSRTRDDAQDPTTEAPAEPRTTAGRALWDRSPVGAWRLFTPHMATQMGWWLPLAAIGLLLGGRPWRRKASRRGATLAATPAQAQLLLWGGWLATYGAAFSLAGGVFHTYYVALLGAPLAALAGIGAAALWRLRPASPQRWALPAAVLLLAAWQAYLHVGGQGGWLGGWPVDLLAGTLIALVAAAIGWCLWPAAAPEPGSTGLALLALGAVLALPLAWASSVVLVRPNVAAPVVDLTALWRSPPPDEDAAALRTARSQKLLDYLRAQRQAERYLVAVPNAMQAAPLIVQGGEPVMALGGYLGRDPILTPARLARLVADGTLRYAIVGGPSLVRPAPPQEQALADWIVANGQRVDSALWREPPAPGARSARPLPPGYVPARLYDLRPDRVAAIAQPPEESRP